MGPIKHDFSRAMSPVNTPETVTDFRRIFFCSGFS